jgi:hypothetical protein
LCRGRASSLPPSAPFPDREQRAGSRLAGIPPGPPRRSSVEGKRKRP